MKKRRFCHICQIECPSTSVLKMHIERNHIKAENKQQKETHIKEKPLIIKKNPTFKCEKCGFGFFTQDRLDKHAIIHTPHTCGICGKTLTSKRGLLRHIDVVHCDENNHLCALCGNRYHSLHSLKKHMLTHKNEDISSDTRKYECPECGNRFKCGSYLKCHMMVHEKKKFMNASLETSAVKKAFDEVLNK